MIPVFSENLLYFYKLYDKIQETLRKGNFYDAVTKEKKYPLQTGVL